MLTREEYLIVQNQLLELSDSKRAYLSEIEELKQANKQIPLMRERVSQIHREIGKMEESYYAEIEQIQKKINSIKESKGGTLLDSIMKIGESNKITQLNEKMARKSGKISSLSSMESSLMTRESAQRELIRLLGTSIKDMSVSIAKLQKMKSCADKNRGILLYLCDIESKLAGTAESIRSITEKKAATKESILKYHAMVDSKMKTIAASDDTLVQLICDQSAITDGLNESRAELAQSLDDLKLTRADLGSVKQQSINLDEYLTDNLQQLTAENEFLDSRISTLTEAIRSHPREFQRILQRTVEKKDQLEKRLKAVKRDIDTEKIISGSIADIYNRTDQQINMAINLKETIAKNEKTLFKLKSDNERKARVYEELKAVLPPRKVQNDQEAIAYLCEQFNNCRILNHTLLDEIVSLKNELECIKQENETLRQIQSGEFQ